MLNSLPEFVVGLLMLLVLRVRLGWLPVESSGAVVRVGMDQIEAYILPMMTLVIVVTPYMARMVRVKVRDTPRTAVRAQRRAARRRTPELMWRHVVPNASVPVVNVVALNMAELIGGVVVIEMVFGFPGIGQLLVDAVLGEGHPDRAGDRADHGLGYVRR